MTRDRLQSILTALPTVSVAVFGDFFLDRYFVIDPALEEVSVETGLPVHQVVGKRLTPGAAGTIVSNLRALGVGRVVCVGVIGVDGEGFELTKCLHTIGADDSHLIRSESRVTPCYTKPMRRENGRETEMERIDIKNRFELPSSLEDELISRIRDLLPQLGGVIIADQVQERNHGAVTDRVREEVCSLARINGDKVFFVDSRLRIGEYHGVIIKPNKVEAYDAVKGGARADKAESAIREVALDEAIDCARALYGRTGKAVFMTAQQEGIFLAEREITHVPAVPVTGEIDPVGAGDSCTAGAVSALCAGATYEEAAFLGNLVASVTVRKIGQTGTATPAELLERYDEAIT